MVSLLERSPETLDNLAADHSRRHFLAHLTTLAAGLKPLKDYEELPGGAIRIVDWHSSAYLEPLNESASDYMLIDGGMSKDARSIIGFLASRGQDFTNIKGIIVTHAHPDHMGGLFMAREHKLPVFVGKADAPVLNGEELAAGLLTHTCNILGLLDAAVPGLNLELVEDGQVLKEFGDRRFDIIGVPGHTPGSVAVLASWGNDLRNLYPGDAWDYKKDGSVVNAAPVFSEDREASARSIVEVAKRLKSFDIQAVIPAHSGHGSFEATQAFRRAA